MSASPFSSGYSIPNTVADGLFVPIGGGSNTVTGLTVSQAAQTLTMTARTTNYGYIDPGTGLVAVNTTGFITGQVPLFIAVADTFQVTAINDVRVTYTSAAGGSGTPALPFTSVQFNNSGVFGGNANLEWDNTNNQLFIGGPSVTTSAALTIIGAGAGNAAAPIETHSLFANGLSMFTHSNTGFRAPSVQCIRSRGTQLNPTGVTSADNLGFWTFLGHDGTAYAQGAQINAQIGTAWNTGNHNTVLVVLAVPANSTTITEVFRFNSNANAGGDVTGNISTLDLGLPSTRQFMWNASGDGISGSADTGLSRISAAVVALGNGTVGNFSGQLQLGNEVLTSAAPTVVAAQVGLGSTTASTVGAAGGASALPATPTGYLIINVAGTAQKIPYYNN